MSMPAPVVRTFRGDKLLQLAMPMGGIGAGCVCLSGYGALQDFSIRNKPATSAVPDGHGTHDAAFAVLHVKGPRPVTKLLEGPVPVERIYDQGLKAQGYRLGAYEGLPRFEACEFDSCYPFGTVRLSHPQVPLKVSITGWNPFIPLDDRDSSLPCAILDHTLANDSDQPVEFEFSYHLSHLAGGRKIENSRNEALNGFGVRLYNTEHADDEHFGSAALGVIGHKPKIKAMWFRGGWFDWISALWREVSTGTFTQNFGNTSKPLGGRNGGSVLVPGKLAPGESVTIPVVIAWYIPNVHYAAGELPGAPETVGLGVKGAPPKPKWKPYYTSVWQDAADVAHYVADHYPALRRRTVEFAETLTSSTLPREVIDAVSSNLAILKSPTVLRQANGNVWAWEGCFAGGGCCHGTCTHVWNYAQALPHLFPALERTLREQELDRSMDDRGHVSFRAALPDGPAPHNFHAAADGQLGGILKLYRDWQISGDRQWMARLYPQAKKSLVFCIEAWDPKHEGGLFEPHHNTYDIEFWGPDGMCGSIYAGALSAMAAMARELKQDDDARFFGDLALKAAALLDGELFNGEYHQQQVMWRQLRDQSFAKLVAKDDDGDEVLRLLKAEGPKYQYGRGCLSDGVIGAWMASLYGVETPMDPAKTRSTLSAIFRHNFREDLSDHVCTQRPGYAMGHEPGLLLCTWPRGGKPTLPFVYSDEVWTGIEYQVASHLILEGMVDEGLRIVRAVRARYDGHVRNPFNEYECGSYYARALSSYALLQALSGFRYSAAEQRLWYGPKLKARPFRSFFCAASGWGTITLDEQSLTVRLIEGSLPLRQVDVSVGAGVRVIAVEQTRDDGRTIVVPVRG